jgi:hypothetical protein
MPAADAASQAHAGWPVRAVPVQAGKVCNHRASPNRHLSSIPRNGYSSANTQCAGRATAHGEPLVDGKIRRPVNVCFREAAARHAMAGQSPERAESTNFNKAPVRMKPQEGLEPPTSPLRKTCPVVLISECILEMKEPKD